MVTKTLMKRMRHGPSNLLEVLKEAAKKLQKDTIETWNLPDNLKEMAEKTEGKTFSRVNHLSTAKWYGPESRDQLIWLFNERFSWC